jgi:hypothetical protein
MSFSDMGVQLIEVMNSKRSSPRTKQRLPSAQSKDSAQSLQQTTPKAARPTKADSDDTGLEIAPKTSKARRIRGHAVDWQQWDQLAEQLGYSDQDQAEVLHYLLGVALSPMPQVPLLPALEPALEAQDKTISPTDLLSRTTALASQILGVMTTLTLQFQQQQQQNLQLSQLLTQVLEALTAGLSAESIGRGTGVRSGSAITKDSFAVLNSQDLKKSHAKGSAEEKLRRAFQAIVSHNEAAERPHADKWAVNQNALAELTGCNRPAIKQFLKQYGSEIESHHQTHGLMPRHNYTHGKVGTKITDVIHW